MDISPFKGVKSTLIERYQYSAALPSSGAARRVMLRPTSLKTGEQHRASVATLGLQAHVLGRRRGDLSTYPGVEPSLRAVTATHDGIKPSW